MNTDLLVQQRKRINEEQSAKHSKQDISFEERDYYRIDQLKLQLIDQLILLSQTSNSKNQRPSKLLASLAPKYKQYLTSLLTFSSDIQELANSAPLISLPHRHHTSQSALLSLILSTPLNKEVILMAHPAQISRICHIFANQTELDTVGYVKNSLAQEGVQFVQMNKIQNETIIVNQNHIVIIDLFGLDPTQYYLTLGTSITKLFKASHLITYFSTRQQADVDHFFKIISKQHQCSNILTLQLAPPHPTQIHSCEQPQQLLNEVFNFLQSISRYSQKQDIIIFVAPHEPLFKYLKQIKEELVKNGLKDAVNLVTSAHQKLTREKSSIFFVKNNRQLKQWKYDYSNVFMVIDYGFEYNFVFDYTLGCHLEKITAVSVPEKCERMGWVGADRGGKYFYCIQETIISSNYLTSACQISGYLLQAIHRKQLDFIDIKHTRVAQCIQFLKLIGIIQITTENTISILDQRYIQYLEQGISPINTKLMLTVLDDAQLVDKNQQKYLNLMAMTIAVVSSQGSLRKIKQELEGSHIKPYAVWRKSGYLQSCLEIITKCQLIQSRKQPHNSKSQQFRRRASKKMSNSFEVFEKHQTRRKKNFEDMDVTDLIIDYTVNEDLLHHIRDKVEELREIFEFQMIPILLQKQNVNKILTYWLKSSAKESVGIYSGSKNTEYFNSIENIFLNQQCLFYVLNQRPELLKILRMTVIQNKKAIVFANSLQKQSYLEHFGKIPSFQIVSQNNKKEEIDQTQNQQQSQAIVAKQFAFENLSSAVLEELVKDNGAKIEEFEEENNCHLSFNMEIGKLTLICFKDEVQNKNYVKQNLNLLLNRTTQLCQFYNKKLHYLGVLSFILGEGGKIIEVTDSNHITRCLLKNLPPEIAKEYVEVVLEDYHLKSIEILEADQVSQKASAIIEFYSKQTYEKFLNDYENNLARHNYFTVESLKEHQYNKLKNEQTLQFGNIRTTLMFRWFTWKSHGTAQILFRSPEAVAATIEAFQINPILDYSQVKVTTDPKNKRIINIQNLNIHTDQIYIEEALRNYGDIESVQILKTPLKQTLGDVEHIGHLLKSTLGRKDPLKYKVLSIDKKQHGLRIAKVAIEQTHTINQICEGLNRGTNVFGQGRLYVEPIFQRQILIPQGCIEIYTELFEQLMASLQKDKPKIKKQIRQDQQNLYMAIISPIEETLLFFLARLKEKLAGVKIDFPFQAKTVIMNQIGIANFLDMEEKFNCKFIISIYAGKIRVLAKEGSLKAIASEVQDRINNHFFYKVSLTSKNYKHYQNSPELLIQLQKRFELTLTELEEDNFSLLLEGSAISIKDAVVWIHKKVKVEGKTLEGEQVNLCGICYESSQDSYRLFCSHRFCRECLIDYLRYSLGDMSMFPLRCPFSQCRKLVSCIDLEHLFQQIQWYKMRTLTANQFLKTNDNYNYCMTPGCEQINRIQNANINGVYAEFMRCDICKNSYCLKCNEQYHPARTCSQAKVSEDELLKNYITDQGVRKCVGRKCKALVMRYTGCFKVQCSRCSICMCFKCPPDKMEAFETPRQCYDHLTNEHGGYY